MADFYWSEDRGPSPLILFPVKNYAIREGMASGGGEDFP